MIEIRWDDKLPAIHQKTPEEEEIDRWDSWFETVGMTNDWEIVKSQIADHIGRLQWAQIMELNRIKKVSPNGNQ